MRKKIAYVAEKRKPKAVSYFERKEQPDTVKGEKFKYIDDWGEQFTAKCHPVVCVLHLHTGEITIVEDGLDELSSGQVAWCPDSRGLVFCSYVHTPFRIGVMYCPQRRSFMYHFDLATGRVKCIVDKGDNSVRSPRFSPDGSKLVYLECEAGGPHHKCLKLMICQWPFGVHRTLVDIVRRPDEGFCGLYSATLVSRCWSTDSRYVLCHSPVQSRQDVFAVDTSDGTITRITEELASWSLLDVCDDFVLIGHSLTDSPPCLAVGKFPSSGAQSLAWSFPEPPPKIEGIKWTIKHHLPSQDHPTYDKLSYESILVEPTDRKSDGLIVFPHGGPHSAFTIEYHPYFAALSQGGFSVLLVNYRGSTGFGEDSICSLLGNIGSQDIADVQKAAEDILTEYDMDRERVGVIGGSHGGFITAHLIGQYPGFYKAAVMRNPVTNVVGLLGCTDIPDWGFVECGYSDYKVGRIADDEGYRKIHSKSPMSYIDQVKTPTLIMLGANDRRVPSYLGVEFHKALLSRDVPSRLLLYPDNCHPIKTVEAESDSYVNLYLWFKKYIDAPTSPQ